MSRPVWLVQLLKKAFPARLLAARATRVPVLGGILDRWLFEGDDLMFLPRDQVIQINQSFNMPGDVVLPSRVVEHFIEQASHHWVMDFCICREANQCEDYPADLGCLFLGQAALGINPELGRRVTQEEALEHVRCCRRAGLVHLIGRNKLDTVWLGVSPGSKLLTICNCCPCCCLWDVLPHTAPWLQSRITRMPGVAVAVNERCVGCGACTQEVCFVDAIQLAGDRAVISDACRGCGRCVSICPEQAIEIAIEDRQFVEESVSRISRLVDVS